MDASGYAWVAEAKANTVSVYSPSGVKTQTYPVGTYPEYLVLDGMGSAWVTNNGSVDVTKIPAGTTHPLGTLQKLGPTGIAKDAAGNLWVANYGTGGANGNTVMVVAPNGTVGASYDVGSAPVGVAIDAVGNVWVALNFAGAVTKLTPNGTPIAPFPVALNASNPHDIALDAQGNAWVSGENGSVVKVSSAGAVLGTFVTTGMNTYGIAIDPRGDVWVTNSTTANVTKLAP
jgi:streptogramin lyase